jgi:hypothetical protein
MIYLLNSRATKRQIEEMLQTLETYIKLAVDVEMGVLAGGGALHADCEAVLIEDDSQQQNIWGADWIPETQEVRFEALINIRPRQNNRSMTIQDAAIRQRVEEIVRSILEDV